MNYIKKALSTLGGIFLAALLIAALAPRATHAVVAALVQVANTDSSPVPTAEALGTATLIPIGPFGTTCTDFAGDDGSPGSFFANCYTVPPGKRAVVENVTGFCGAPKGVSIAQLSITVYPSDYIPADVPGMPQYFPVQLTGNPGGDSFNFFTVNVTTRFYADPGDILVLGGFSSDTAGQTYCTLGINGRLVPTS